MHFLRETACYQCFHLLPTNACTYVLILYYTLFQVLVVERIISRLSR
jgi:hypothetical protein